MNTQCHPKPWEYHIRHNPSKPLIFCSSLANNTKKYRSIFRNSSNTSKTTWNHMKPSSPSSWHLPWRVMTLKMGRPWSPVKAKSRCSSAPVVIAPPAAKLLCSTHLTLFRELNGKILSLILSRPGCGFLWTLFLEIFSWLWRLWSGFYDLFRCYCCSSSDFGVKNWDFIIQKAY